jgi:hypothetical protein
MYLILREECLWNASVLKYCFSFSYLTNSMEHSSPRKADSRLPSLEIPCIL